jgi:phenylpropionate dioxygenase-like ring-hydroxylating dioxygenase large terminal subunit
MTEVRSYQQLAETLADYVEHGKTQQAAAPFEVAAASYLDPARWTLEMERIFKRLPLLLGFTAELPKPGDFKTLEPLGVPVLIARGKDGVVRAFLNVCTHRGNVLAMAEHGNCRGFSCTYHGWTFANDGRLIGVADSPKFGEIDKSARNLRELPCAERGGLIFAALSPDATIDVDDYYGQMLPDLDRYGFKDWHYCGKREIFGANWKIAYDGYLEGYHFAAAHPKTIHPRTVSDVMTFDAYGPHLRIGFAATPILSRLAAVPKLEWADQENVAFDFVRTLFPNTSIFVAPEITQFATIFPGPKPGENRTVLSFLRRNPPEDAEDLQRIEQMMDFLQNVVNDEDYLLGLRVQKGLESGALQSVVFGRNEQGNQHFHHCVDHYVAAEDGAPVPVL